MSPAVHAVVETVLGELTLVRDDAGLTGLYFPGHRPRLDPATFGRRISATGDGVLGAAARQLAEYLAGERTEFDLPLNPHGSDLARRVWQLLAAIRYGATTTYGAIDRQLGHRIGPRAVGRFVARNPLSVVVGCHRVVGSTGQLTGYAGGLRRKQYLLELERTGSTRPLW